MGGIGAQNPLAFEIGGGESEFERVWRELRKALGEGGAGPEDSIEDTWRQAKALGIVMATAGGERALLQFLPQYATDHVEVYEDLLRVSPSSSEEAARVATTAAYTLKLSALIPDLRAKLQAIDPNMDVVTQATDQAILVQSGKYLRGRPAGGFAAIQYGDKSGSAYPNFSSFFILTILWSGLGTDPPPAAELLEVTDLLNKSLPSWVDWRIMTGTGFFLDGFNDTRLDLTAFGT